MYVAVTLRLYVSSIITLLLSTVNTKVVVENVKTYGSRAVPSDFTTFKSIDGQETFDSLELTKFVSKVRTIGSL